MRKHLYFFSLIGLLTLNGRSQNLVNNGSFEIYSALPTGYNQLNLASGWSNCNGHYATQGTWGSPDYKHTLGTGDANLPGNYVASTSPYNGNACVGFVTYNGFCADCREYIRTYLTTPMTVGVTYSVSFYATTGYSCAAKYVSNNIGILFSKDSTWQPGAGNVLLNRIPQYNMNTILDTAGWKKFSFTFTADSSYKYITIGSYKSDANTALMTKNGSNQLYAYNFVDDFSVVAISSVGINENAHQESSVVVFPNPNNGEALIKGTREEILDIVNELGQSVLSVRLTMENNYSATVNSLLPGIYFVNGNYTRTKLVVSK